MIIMIMMMLMVLTLMMMIMMMIMLFLIIIMIMIVLKVMLLMMVVVTKRENIARVILRTSEISSHIPRSRARVTQLSNKIYLFGLIGMVVTVLYI